MYQWFSGELNTFCVLLYILYETERSHFINPLTAGVAYIRFYIIGTHSNNVLIWFTKRILSTVFLCPYNVCLK